MPVPQAVRLSNCQTVKMSGCQALRLSGCHTVRLTGSQAVRREYVSKKLSGFQNIHIIQIIKTSG